MVVVTPCGINRGSAPGQVRSPLRHPPPGNVVLRRFLPAPCESGLLGRTLSAFTSAFAENTSSCRSLADDPVLVALRSFQRVNLLLDPGQPLMQSCHIGAQLPQLFQLDLASWIWIVSFFLHDLGTQINAFAANENRGSCDEFGDFMLALAAERTVAGAGLFRLVLSTRSFTMGGFDCPASFADYVPPRSVGRHAAPSPPLGAVIAWRACWPTFSRNDQRQRMVCRASPLMEEIPAPLPANQGREQWQPVILSSLRREQWQPL